jgi:hypothetical protein
MSLLTCASPWTTDNNISKKRMPSLRKTIKKHSPPKQEEEEEEESLEEIPSNSFETTIDNQETRNNHVSKLLDNMSNVNANESDSGLSDFQPLSHPSLQNNEELLHGRNAEATIPYSENALQSPPSRIKQTIGDFTSSQSDANAQSNPYHVNNYSNYRRIYEPPKVSPPNDYYAKMGLGKPSTLDNSLLEKVNYMIHMLEQQQNEKTSNLTEEFILYIFLGVFIIFIVDSFTRGGGKYVR